MLKHSKGSNDNKYINVFEGLSYEAELYSYHNLIILILYYQIFYENIHSRGSSYYKYITIS